MHACMCLTFSAGECFVCGFLTGEKKLQILLHQTPLRVLGFTVTDERDPDPGTGVCTMRKGALYVTGGCGGYFLDVCQTPPPS